MSPTHVECLVAGGTLALRGYKTIVSVLLSFSSSWWVVIQRLMSVVHASIRRVAISASQGSFRGTVSREVNIKLSVIGIHMVFQVVSSEYGSEWHTGDGKQ